MGTYTPPGPMSQRHTHTLVALHITLPFRVGSIITRQVASSVRRMWLLGGHAADVRSFNASSRAASLAAIPQQHLGMSAWQGVYAKEVLGGERGELDAPSSGWIGEKVIQSTMNLIHLLSTHRSTRVLS